MCMHIARLICIFITYSVGFMHIFERTDENCPQFADNEDLQSEWREAKRRNKVKVASFLREKTGYIVNPDAMFDVQVS